MKVINQMELKFLSLSENERFARACVASFCSQLNPTIDELNDIRTAVSEAVTNCVVHAYPNCIGEIVLKVLLHPNNVTISITDFGVGINDIARAREPFFTTNTSGERSGMGFTIMESFMDNMEVINNKTCGTTVKMSKGLAKEQLVEAN